MVMFKGWLRQAGAFKVEHVPCPDYAGDVTTVGPRRGVQHTTEGALEGALSEFLVKYAPHFLVGWDSGRARILQLLPIGRAAAALEHPPGTAATNGEVHAQVELADFSERTPWLPKQKQVQQALADLYATLGKACGIPLNHVANPSRSRVIFDSRAGWYGHGDVPDQTAGHWDPGNLQYEALFGLAVHRNRKPTPIVQPKPRPVILQPRTWVLVRNAQGGISTIQIDRPH